MAKLDSVKKAHWKRLGIKDTASLKKCLINIFDNQEHDHQQNILIDIYKMVLPDWDNIVKMNSYPSAGHELWKFIFELFQEFDKKHHPNCMPGGIWFDSGFSADSQLSPWEINFKSCSISYKEN